MATEWMFSESFVTKAPLKVAWAYWADTERHAEMEGVKIELDGPFESGSQGRTITKDEVHEWVLSEVIFERRFVIAGNKDGFQLSFAWEFEAESGGTRMTQTIHAQGTEADMNQWSDVLRAMEGNAPHGMKLLQDRLDALGNESHGR